MIALILSDGCFSTTTSTKDFLARSVTVSEHRYAYRVWLPPHFTKMRSWPVVLYLHGSEERGDDNLRPLTAGLPAALEEYGPRFRSIVVIPQCRDGSEWYGEMEQQALNALDATIREFHGDPRRVILTGVSMGGAGAWYMARHHGRFAAVAPISGEVVRQPDDPFPEELPEDLALLLHAPDPYAALAGAIGHTPVWAFHGELDPIIPATESRRMVEELRAAGDEVFYTEYPGGGHDAWDDAYSDPQFVQWMLRVRARP